MLKDHNKKQFYTTEVKRGYGDTLQHNIRYEFNNGWQLSLALGATAYAKKVPGTGIYEQVEVAIFHNEEMVYIDKASDTVIPYVPVSFISTILEILSIAKDRPHSDTMKALNDLVEWVNEWQEDYYDGPLVKIDEKDNA
jgi:hypothetical protein